MPEIAAPPFSFEPIVTVYLKFDRRVRLAEPMCGQVGGLAQWFFDRYDLRSVSNPRSLPQNEDEGLIAAVISASGPHELLTQEQLAAQVLSELSRHIPGLPAPLWYKVITEKYATFACTPEACRPSATTCYPGAFLTGDYVGGDYPATLEGAVRNGISAANAMISHLQTSPVKSVA